MSIDAMKQALEALEYIENNYMSLPAPAIKAIAALRLAIEQAERVKRAEEAFAAASDEMKGEQAERQAPVAYTQGHCKEKAKPGGCQLHNLHCGYPACDRKPVTAPPQRQPLTEEELEELMMNYGYDADDECMKEMLKEAIERAHGIGGGE
jgi:hypothetical protein